MAHCVDALKRWTGKTRATIVYDSTVDEFSADALFTTIQDKPNIALIGFTTDGDVFGGFYSVAVTEQDEWFYDQTIFAFSFESHGRCKTPQGFDLAEGVRDISCLAFMSNSPRGFVQIGAYGGGCFSLGNEQSDTFCFALSSIFKRLDDQTLSGQSSFYHRGPFHHCTRLVAVYLV